jgi:hypothetical protein
MRNGRLSFLPRESQMNEALPEDFGSLRIIFLIAQGSNKNGRIESSAAEFAASHGLWRPSACAGWVKFDSTTSAPWIKLRKIPSPNVGSLP